jgi:hypothetical protein
MSEQAPAEFGHEQTLQTVLQHLLTLEGGDLEHLCEAADVPALVDSDGQPVYIRSARSYHDAEILTLDKGVWIELSDGSQFGFTITVGHRPTNWTP